MNPGSFKNSKYLQREIISWHRKQNKVTELAAYMPKLRGRNQEAYNTIGLYLMEYFRNEGQTGNAQFMKSLLLSANPNDAEVLNRAKWFEVTNRWPGLVPPAGRLASADSADLADIASSNTSLAKPACWILGQYYLGNNCSGNAELDTRYAMQEGQTVETGIKQLYPNPAQTEATLAYALPTGSRSAKLIITDIITGRQIQSVALSATEGAQESQIDLRSFKAGLYNCALLIDEKPAGNRKLSVMK